MTTCVIPTRRFIWESERGIGRCIHHLRPIRQSNETQTFGTRKVCPLDHTQLTRHL